MPDRIFPISTVLAILHKLIICKCQPIYYWNLPPLSRKYCSQFYLLFLCCLNLKLLYESFAFFFQERKLYLARSSFEKDMTMVLKQEVHELTTDFFEDRSFLGSENQEPTTTPQKRRFSCTTNQPVQIAKRHRTQSDWSGPSSKITKKVRSGDSA